MIVLEGADLAGKSTLGDLVARKLDLPAFHLGRPPVGTRHWDLVRKALCDNPMDAVYDRMCIGSYVYGIIKPDKYNQNSVTLEELHRWWKLMMHLETVIIYCYSEPADARKRYDARGDDYVSFKEIEDAAAVYWNVFARWDRAYGNPNLLFYNSSKYTPEDFFARHQGRLKAASKFNTPPLDRTRKLILDALS